MAAGERLTQKEILKESTDKAGNPSQDGHQSLSSACDDQK